MGGGRVDEKAKMPSKGPFLDLEMMGEAGRTGHHGGRGGCGRK